MVYSYFDITRGYPNRSAHGTPEEAIQRQDQRGDASTERTRNHQVVAHDAAELLENIRGHA